MDGFWHIGETTAYQSGVDYGNGSRPIKVVAKRVERAADGNRLAYVVVKIPSGHHWAGRGMGTESHPGEYHVLHIMETHDNGVYWCKDLMDFPLRN